MKYQLSFIICIFMLSSCSIDFEYGSPFPCFFCFDNSIHLNELMASALTPYSNTFVRVRKKVSGKVNYCILDTNSKSEDVPITTEKENFARYALGGNECIIIGYSTLNERPVAYDGMCRYCYESSGRYITLNWHSETSVICDKCHKIYNLLMNGISDDDTPTKLWPYHISAPSPFGIVSIGG